MQTQLELAAVFVEVTLCDLTEPSVSRFERTVKLHPEIRQCYAISGSADYLLVIASKSIEEFSRIHREIITRLPSARKIRSTFSLRNVKVFDLR
ncbi:Lrp/AsnC ligand binding domain-containing protein [Aminobacter carboxidus]|uniref:Lrp/AsnC ligand binding domain-containing protein n=1 Tax=Aminobacter carboxidus TaxID=376165 RepID=UPI0034D969AA